VKFLLDVNVLVAWGWADHADHARVEKWLARERANPANLFLTSPIPELGFVRISVQRAEGQISVAEAAEALTGMVTALGRKHSFVSDDTASRQFPEWCTTASRTTDAHLAALATNQGAKLATLDERIPGAFLLPR
jgi:predicted nucleic acid-binding protein